MRGIIDQNGRALINVELRLDAEAAPETIETWIDTGFTGDLMLPQWRIDELGMA